MDIRRMTVDDYEAVHALWTSTPGMGLNDLDDSREGIARFLRRNPGTSFIAERDGAPVGVVLCGHDGRRGYIYHTAVAAREQRKGIGSALVERALSALREEGIHKAALVVFSENGKGNAFWERRGFFARGDLVYRNRELVKLRRMDVK